MTFKYFSKNGELLPIEEAVVPLSNIEYQYGFGVYETIRVANGIPYFLSDHLERLEESAKITGLEHPFTSTTIYGSVEKLVEKIGVGTYNLKILLIGGREPSLFVLSLNPHFPDKKLYRDGASFITHHYERPFPHAKCLNMLQSYLAYKKAREAGCYDALLVNSRNCITEGTRTNFFCLKDKTLYSPPENEILLGVTRKVVLQVAQENGFVLEERDIHVVDLQTFDGAFVTSTSSKIIPVHSVDTSTFPALPSTLRTLMERFDTFLSRN
jgi:branched-subunit amino acid aminotransferase/4-amino-4-deoxychorismate lyase